MSPQLIKIGELFLTVSLWHETSRSGLCWPGCDEGGGGWKPREFSQGAKCYSELVWSGWMSWSFKAVRWGSRLALAELQTCGFGSGRWEQVTPPTQPENRGEQADSRDTQQDKPLTPAQIVLRRNATILRILRGLKTMLPSLRIVVSSIFFSVQQTWIVDIGSLSCTVSLHNLNKAHNQAVLFLHLHY